MSQNRDWQADSCVQKSLFHRLFHNSVEIKFGPSYQARAVWTSYARSW